MIEPSWDQVLADEFKKDYMKNLSNFLVKERSHHSIYPPRNLVFNAFKHTPYDKVRVVIVGQDPYHGPGQAHGLSFSVPENVPAPPSLQNIFKEIHDDLGLPIPIKGNLVSWAEQGVLLLNAVLTVRAHSANSHQGKGWERFTDSVIAKLCQKKDPLIFVLWGNYAKKKVEHVAEFKEHPALSVLTAAHPSPLAAHKGFFGCRHFSKINEILTQNKLDPINWML
ncbi:uracil-DNA glycosylase [Waddlia chondrophila 2032/99]|nr:uracil-DNA glycosylase [Waddlia chondrophila]CCB90534.1 uracil-DNA glycosylase [Waddlia chondrophila 2032/99]